MKRIVLIFLTCVLLFSLAGCGNVSSTTPNSSTSTDPQKTSDDSEIQTPPLVDYVDILRQAEAYDGQYISVAGRITNFNNDYSFYFNERLGLNDDGLGFQISVDHTCAVKGLYSVGDYVIVEGVWHNGYFSQLQEAKVVLAGTAALEI